MYRFYWQNKISVLHILTTHKCYNEHKLGRENGKWEADYLIYNAKKSNYLKHKTISNFGILTHYYKSKRLRKIINEQQ